MQDFDDQYRDYVTELCYSMAYLLVRNNKGYSQREKQRKEITTAFQAVIGDKGVDNYYQEWIAIEQTILFPAYLYGQQLVGGAQSLEQIDERLEALYTCPRYIQRRKQYKATAYPVLLEQLARRIPDAQQLLDTCDDLQTQDLRAQSYGMVYCGYVDGFTLMSGREPDDGNPVRRWMDERLAAL